MEDLFSDKERTGYIEKIQEFFKVERDEEIGIIGADALLDFFIHTIGKDMCKKFLTTYRDKIIIKLDDAEVETLTLLE
jgi:uncharacterized protein (DUF2164 family)